jgi:hypothetical protein
MKPFASRSVYIRAGRKEAETGGQGVGQAGGEGGRERAKVVKSYGIPMEVLWKSYGNPMEQYRRAPAPPPDHARIAPRPPQQPLHHACNAPAGYPFSAGGGAQLQASPPPVPQVPLALGGKPRPESRRVSGVSLADSLGPPAARRPPPRLPVRPAKVMVPQFSFSWSALRMLILVSRHI